MKVDLNILDDKSFQVSERYLPDVGKVYLVLPAMTKHIWGLEELHLRSLLCLPGGEVISSGLPKFTNYSEDEKHDLITDRLLATGEVFFTEKLDGSLIIRSVFDGKVILRTRGSHEMSAHFFTLTMNLINERYPKLMDPRFFSEESIVFEFTSPNNLIVEEYEDDELTALGYISHEDLSFHGRPDDVGSISYTFGVPGIKFLSLSDNFDEVKEQVRNLDDGEGIVVRMAHHGEKIGHMAKLKASRYLLIHAFKYNLSGKKLKMFCYAKNIRSNDDFKHELYALGLDWEVMEHFSEEVETLLKSIDESARQVLDFISELKAKGVDSLETKKEKVEGIKAIAGSDKSLFGIAIQYLFGDEDRLYKTILARTLGMSSMQLNHFIEQSNELVDKLSSLKKEKYNDL